MTVEITFAEAALGAELTLPTLEGTVALRVPPGTRSGRTFRVRGRGLKCKDSAQGDLLVTVEIAVPSSTSLDPAAVVAIEQLKSIGPQADRRLVQEALHRSHRY
jgi:molecular chaperone DnaJ